MDRGAMAAWRPHLGRSRHLEPCPEAAVRSQISSAGVNDRHWDLPAIPGGIAGRQLLARADVRAFARTTSSNG